MKPTTKLTKAIAVIRKAIAGAVAVGVLAVLHKVGLQIPVDAIQEIVNAAIVGGIVYAVPNAKPYVEDDNEEQG